MCWMSFSLIDTHFFSHTLKSKSIRDWPSGMKYSTAALPQLIANPSTLFQSDIATRAFLSAHYGGNTVQTFLPINKSFIDRHGPPDHMYLNLGWNDAPQVPGLGLFLNVMQKPFPLKIISITNIRRRHLIKSKKPSIEVQR